MGIEIERKFLVKKERWKEVNKTSGEMYRQGYLLTDPNKTIRVRQTNDKGFLTIKGISVGASRAEYEYEIPWKEAEELLDQFAVSELSKIRYKILFENKLWEIDEFLGDNEGLIVAEIELTSENETFTLPDWIGCEVTGEERYYNSNLVIEPFVNWKL
ncbi:CYTH domain-containing protein [Kaistella sp.]|uniref:CYTH domain-containing protein n=1 Tax=Kaistella sp. TaxID=2782235 RepID=UPI003C477726